MPELKINISETTHKHLLSLAKTSGEPIQIILHRAIESYRRQLFLSQVNQAYSDLRQNEDLWQEELAERQAWDQTLIDGSAEE